MSAPELSSTRTRRRRQGLADERVLAALALAVLALLAGLELTGAREVFAHTALQRPFDERFAGYTPALAEAVRATLQGEAWRAYLAYRTLDLLLPWALGAFLVGSLRRLGAPLLAWLGWAAALVDTLENLALWRMLLQVEPLSVDQVQWASAMTQAKWVVDGLALAALVLMVVLHGLAQARLSRPQEP